MRDQKFFQSLAVKHGTPIYVYDGDYLRRRASDLLALCKKQGWLLRYALKANSHPEIVRLYDSLGLHFDASSDYEAHIAIEMGIKPAKISLSSQQSPQDMTKILKSGVRFVATSFHQLSLVDDSGWRGEIAVRVNPSSGSGHNNRTTTGGANSSFGIWHEYLSKISDWEKASECTIDRLHIHVGSGVDSASWQANIKSALEIAEQLPNVETLNMGGGFKVARMPDESEVDMAEILNVFAGELRAFTKRTGRRFSLEIEPGSWLVAGGGWLLAQVVDIVDTGNNGYNFLKLDTGMNDFLRPTMYGAQHPIEVLSDSKQQMEYVVVGHNCETGDILTPATANPEQIQPRRLNRARIGDLVVIGCVGAYAASMRAVGYNSFPSAEEIFIS